MTITGCDKLIAKLNKAESGLKDASAPGALHDYMYDMWMKGYNVASACYENATTLEGEKANEHTSMVADPIFDAKGMNLTAEGEDIAFLEFGTGLNMTEHNPYANKMGFYPGSWSVNHERFLYPNKIYHFQGAWKHNKRLHWGQNPAKGMYNAYKEMELFLRTNPLRLF